jgi:hypothetical protein
MASNRFQRNGKWYRVVLLRVTKSDTQGRPAEASVMYEEQKANIKDGDEFVTAFIPEAVALPKTN